MRSNVPAMTWREPQAAAPEWFTKALDAPWSASSVDVDGATISYLDWGERPNPGLVLVHGGAAHAQWWAYLGPYFTSEWHVVALDMSGHGDSGRRPEYSLGMWAEEVMAVSADAGFPGPPVIVGHSLGGMVTIEAAARYGDELAGAVIVDSPVRRPDPESVEGRTGRTFSTPGVYPTLEEALPHFRLIPEQPCDNVWAIDHIARHSLHGTEAGWTWKFDPVVFARNNTPLGELLSRVGCRVALLRGDKSVVVPPDTADYMYELMDRNAPVVSIPEAYHHLIVDQPLAFVAALRTLLADWEHSTPRGT